MRIVAVLAAYNEERFIAQCLEHLFSQGIEAYLIDNDSTDETVTIAKRYLNHGLVGLERLPREGVFNWKQMLHRMEAVYEGLDADWHMLTAPDEFLVTPWPGKTVAQAVQEIEAQGFNAINSLEFTFIPVKESPDHDHPDFLKTMRWYYAIAPRFPHRLILWKRQPHRVELASTGGHLVAFAGRRVAPTTLYLRHYQFLSPEHIVRKYIRRGWDPMALQAGWHMWRSKLSPEMLSLPSQNDLALYENDWSLDPTRARHIHYLGELLGKHQQQKAADADAARRLREENQQLQQQLRSVSHLAAVASREVEAVHNSRPWRLATRYWRWRDWFKEKLGLDQGSAVETEMSGRHSSEAVETAGRVPHTSEPFVPSGGNRFWPFAINPAGAPHLPPGTPAKFLRDGVLRAVLGRTAPKPRAMLFWQNMTKDWLAAHMRRDGAGIEHRSRLFIRQLVHENESVLDAGCGTGVQYEVMRSCRLARYVGVDSSPPSIEIARAEHPTVDFRVGEVTALVAMFGERAFDVVVMRHVLEHQPDFERPMQQAIAVARRLAVFVFYLPPRDLPLGVRAVDPRADLPFHVNIYARRAIERLLKKSKLTWEWHLNVGPSRAGWLAGETNSVLLVSRSPLHP